MVFIFYVIVFFISLSSLISDYSWGDIVYHHQIFYNFIHGRFFQTSVYWNALVNSNNQYPYLSMFNVHLYLSPFIFSIFYCLLPNLYGLYSMVLAVTYISLAFFLWKLVCLFTNENRFPKYLLIMSFFLSNSFIFLIFVGKASPILLGTPFILAAYYFLQKDQYLLYYLCSVLFCLSYDDCGLLFVSFLGYVYFFEKKHVKPAMVTAVLGVVIVGLIIGVLQPLARFKMTGKSVASVFDAFGVVWVYFTSGHLLQFAYTMMKNLLFFGSLFLVFPVIALWSQPPFPQRRDLYQCLGLIFLAPLSHWASILVNVGVHLLPVVIFSLIAVTLAISRSKLVIPGQWSWRRGLALALVGFYLLGNALGFGYRHRHCLGNEYAEDKKANARCLQTINHLVPVDRGLCYWTARGLDGFLGNRSNLWRFPHFFDQADLLAMQKNARNTFFQADLNPGQDISQALRRGTYHSTGEQVFIDHRAIEAVCHKLVTVNGSHAVIFDDPGMVILKRKESPRLEQPPETRGFGFLRYFPEFWKAKFPG